MKKITWKDRLHYKFDNIMSRGTAVLIGWLFLISVVVILVISLLVMITGSSPIEADGAQAEYWEVAWLSLMRTLDPGTMGGDTGFGFRLWMLMITVSGIFVVSILIGVLTSGIENKLDELRKGRSIVVETGHTVILGWSPKIFMIVSELALANANQPRSCLAILAEKDKVEMEDEIRAKVGHTGRTRIVCRTGNPLDMTDVEIVNPHHARSIIILPPASLANPDSYVIKAILALTNNPNRRPDPYHIVTEVYDPNNMAAVQEVGGSEVEVLLVDDLIAKITVQACRQSGLSIVYSDLLGFSGDEIYFKSEPDLTGQAFGQALLAYEDSTLIGLYTAAGQVLLNPAMDTVIQAGDQVIAISADDDTIRLSGRADPGVNSAAIRAARARPERPEHTLILGWNQRAPAIINQLDYYIPAGSRMKVAADGLESDTISLYGQPIAAHVTCQAADTTNRLTLEALDLPSYQHVVVLSYANTLTPQEADARTLITLLHLRHIAQQTHASFSITSEILDVRDRQLAEVTRADDFIVSDQLISLVLAQVSENKHLATVLGQLFSPEGSELYLRPVEGYVDVGQPLNFYTVVEAARRRGEIAVGYRLQAEAHQAAKVYGVRLNPVKSDRVAFTAGDSIIVLAEA